MLTQEQEELLVTAIEIASEVTHSDAQGMLEAMSESNKSKFLESFNSLVLSFI